MTKRPPPSLESIMYAKHPVHEDLSGPERGAARLRLETARAAKDILKSKLQDETLGQAIDQAFAKVEAALDNPQVSSETLSMLAGRLINLGESKAKLGFPVHALKFYAETWLRLVEDNL